MVSCTVLGFVRGANGFSVPRCQGFSSRGLRELLQQIFHLLVFLQRVCLYVDLLELRREVVVFVSSSRILELFFSLA